VFWLIGSFPEPEGPHRSNKLVKVYCIVLRLFDSLAPRLQQVLTRHQELLSEGHLKTRKRRFLLLLLHMKLVPEAGANYFAVHGFINFYKPSNSIHEPRTSVNSKQAADDDKQAPLEM